MGSIYNTMQEVFDAATRHLLTQNAKASDAGGSCYYRMTDLNGRVLRCAVGGLIPDELYHPRMIGSSDALFDSTDQEVKERVEKIFGSALRWGLGRSFIRLVQHVHDKYPVEAWRGKLASVADLFGLDPKVLDEFPEVAK